MSEEIKVILGQEISCNCRKIYPVEFYANEFKNYSSMRELLKILNKEKAIYLPYSIYHMHSVYSIVIDEEKDLKKYPVEELDLIINGEIGRAHV